MAGSRTCAEQKTIWRKWRTCGEYDGTQRNSRTCAVSRTWHDRTINGAVFYSFLLWLCDTISIARTDLPNLWFVLYVHVLTGSDAEGRNQHARSICYNRVWCLLGHITEYCPWTMQDCILASRFSNLNPYGLVETYTDIKVNIPWVAISSFDFWIIFGISYDDTEKFDLRQNNKLNSVTMLLWQWLGLFHE